MIGTSHYSCRLRKCKIKLQADSGQSLAKTELCTNKTLPALLTHFCLTSINCQATENMYQHKLLMVVILKDRRRAIVIMIG